MKKPLKEQLIKIGGKHLLNESMSGDLERIFKSRGGIHLWNMDMKEAIWVNRAAENQYRKAWMDFYKGYQKLDKFVKTAEKKDWFK